MTTWTSHSEDDTRALAARISERASAPLSIALIGPLGAGKTAFTRGFIQARLPSQIVQSPTFAIARSYPGIHHLDLYRLDDEASLYDLGLIELLHDDGAISLVEWADEFIHLLRPPLLTIRFPDTAAQTRQLSIEWSKDLDDSDIVHIFA